MKLATLLLLFIPHLVFSQNDFLSVGTIESGGEISFASQSSSENNDNESSTTFKSNIYFGVMVARGLELGFRPGFTINSYSGSTFKVIDLYFNPNYNFATTSKVYPYLGFIIGYNSIGYSDDNYGGMTIGGEGGMKFFLSPHALMLFKIEYTSQNYNDVETGFAGGVEDLTVNTVSAGLGFRFFFPRATKPK